MSSVETKLEAPAYEPPCLGEAQSITAVTLFSGTINPDAGVVEFGDGL